MGWNHQLETHSPWCRKTSGKNFARSFPATENSYKRPPLIIQKQLEKRYLKKKVILATKTLWRLYHSTFFSDVFPKLWLLLAVFVKVRRAEGWPGEASTKNTAAIYLVVSNILYFHPYLGKWSNLPNIFRRGWNHQLVIHESLPGLHQEDSRVQIAAVRYKVRRIRSRSRGPDPMDFTQNGH